MKAPSGSKTFRKFADENTKLKQQVLLLTKEIERAVHSFRDLADNGVGIEPLMRSWISVNATCLQESLDSIKEKEDG